MNLRATLAIIGALALAFLTVEETRRRAKGSSTGRRFFGQQAASWGLFVLVFFIALALAAPWTAPYGPSTTLDIVALKNQPPSWVHPLGTDLYSRDVWSRLVYGSRVSLAVGALAMLVAVTVGSTVGAMAGYLRGGVDAVLMRVVDVGLAVPRMFLLLVAIAIWERLPLGVLVLVIGLTGWFGTSRLVRGEVLSLREREFVVAARALGAGTPRILFRHVLPNVVAPIVVSAALGIGNVMLLEAGLSFLGIGVPPPLPSWGNMIADGAPQLATAPWTTLFPGLAIGLVVMALNAVGDALLDALNPRRAAR
ncbi:MAG TPA: ABC transporter permease [Gemmatimonadales bacterium]|nr:ABC transporter permease [Gemmatimonadales bacterium]